MRFYQNVIAGLPTRKPPAANSLVINPRALKQWIDVLPLANVSVAARMLFQVLHELNSVTLEPMARLNALENLRMPVMQLTDAVDNQVIGAGFPLPPAKAQLSTVARDFHRQMSLGYRLVIQDLCGAEGKIPFLRGKTVILSVVRAISHLGAELVAGYFLYASPPQGLWLTLNALFGYAQEAGLVEKAVEDPLYENTGLSARLAYAQIVLLAVSNPYRLNQKEIDEARAVTRIWSAQVHLRSDAARGRAYAIPLEEDRGPGYLPEERLQAQHRVVAFDTSALESDLQRQVDLARTVGGHLTFAAKGYPSVPASAELVSRMMASWQPAAERNFERLPAGYQLDTLLGIHAVHFHLAGGVEFESYLRRVCGTSIHASERQAPRLATMQENLKPQIHSANVLDQSLGGYRLLWEKERAARARVGELIAISAPLQGDETPYERDWMVGVIRWLRISPEGAVDAGISLLSRHARPGVIRALDAQGHPKPGVRSIYLGAQDEPNPLHAVLAPTLLDCQAARYEMRTSPPRDSDADSLSVQALSRLGVQEKTASFLKLAVS